MTRFPFTVSAEHSPYSATVLRLRARHGKILNGLRVSANHADSLLYPTRGDGVRTKSTLHPGTPQFIFLVDSRDQTHPTSSVVQPVVQYRENESLVLLVSWDSVNAVATPGAALIIWNAKDRRAGLRPHIVACEPDLAIEMSLSVLRCEFERMPSRRRIKRIRPALPSWPIWNPKGLIMEKTGVPRVRNLTVSGFRGFETTETLTLAQPNGTPGSGLTIVVGANNVGKSTVWESFEAMSRRFNPAAFGATEVSFSEGKRNRRSTEGVRIQMEFTDGSECTLQSLRPDSSETHARWIPDSPIEPIIPKLVVVPSRRHFQARFGRGGDASQTWMTRGGEYSRSQSRDGFSDRLFELHADPAKKRRFDKLVTEVLGRPLDWTIDLGDGDFGNSYYLKVATGTASHFTSEGLGDGVISLLFVLNALFDADEDTVVVVDEPELSLHPQLIRRLGEVLARYASNTQIVIFTHSPELISWDAVKNGAAVARVYRTGDRSVIAQANSATLRTVGNFRKDWRNPHSVGFDAKSALFLEDGVIVVEGQEDAVLLPKVAELVEVELTGAVYGFGAGGQGNIEHILALLKSLGFVRVAALYDKDVKEHARVVAERFPGYLVLTLPADDIRTKPPVNLKEKPGILNAGASSMQDDSLVEPTREVLTSVHKYLTAAASED